MALSFIKGGEGLKSNQVKQTSALSTTSRVTRGSRSVNQVVLPIIVFPVSSPQSIS